VARKDLAATAVRMDLVTPLVRGSLAASA
jgi:hypothetical protein